MTGKKRRSRKSWLAEWLGDDSDIQEYQPTQRAREGRLPIYETGRAWVVVLPGDSQKRKQAALEGRQWREQKHWLDPEVLIYEEESEAADERS